MKLVVYISLCLLLVGVRSQQIGTQTPEVHPPLPTQICTAPGQCETQQTTVVLDANWRWLHTTQGYTNCYSGNTWDTTICPDPVTCATNCALDGANYEGTYGVSTTDSSLSIGFVTHGPYSTNIGSRLYLMSSPSEYQIFKLVNREFTFDVDVSNMPCGLNGALYFVEMQADGGMAKYPTNKAGAAYGTGYCDAQCPHDLKFIDGEANTLQWTPDSNNPNAGAGLYGTCCVEMDIWEANSAATAYTPHVCSVQGQYRCNGTECGDGDNRYGGVCDKDGCDFNSYRMGNQNFYGKGLTVDSTKPFTVVTQFITDDGTDTGNLAEIKRFYVQNGKTIPNSASNFPNFPADNSITDDFCNAQKQLFGDKNAFEGIGGLKVMGGALSRGVVLVMSLWDDYAADMLWLDSNYPTNGTTTTPGVARGPCSATSGEPSYVESTYPNSAVKFMNIKWGAINSTFAA